MISTEAIERLRPWVLARCERLLDDRALAEEATQEVLIKALGPGTPDDPRELARWINRVATNHCLNRIRDGRVESAARWPWFSRVESPEETVQASTLLSRLFEALPRELRAVCELFYLRDMTQGDVAEAMSCSRRTVLYRLDRIREVALQLDEAY